MSWKGILGKAGVSLTGPNGANDWTFEGAVHARNIISRFAGQHFHVDSGSSAASDSAKYGKRKEKPFATIDYAVGQCTANDGDVIWVHAGHTEAIIAAGGLDLDVEGITIVFLGNGDDQAKITFGTSVGADMDIDADNITLINPRFETAKDALTGPIDVNKANFTIINGEYYDAAGKAAVDCIVAAATATGLTIDGWRFIVSTTGTQKQSNIQLNGVDNAILKDIDIRGDFATGNIENITDEILNVRLEDVYLDNLNSGPKPCIVLDSNCDGYARRVSCRIASGTTYVSSVADINWGPDCLGFNADGEGGDPIGTAPSGSLEGKVDVIDGYHDVPVKDAATDTVMRDVVGRKTDSAAAAAVSEVESIMAYVKQAITLAIARDTAIGVIDGLHDVPTKDAATDLYIRDVVGIKTDTAAAGAVSEVESIMAYVKQAVTEGIARDAVIGALDTAVAAGAVTDADLMMAYIKQLVTAAIAEAAQTLKLDGVTIATAPVAASLASFIASGGTALGTQLPASFSLLDMTIGKKVSRTAADVFDGSQTPLFTISGGRVCIKCLTGEVSVAAIDAGASNLSIVTNPTVGTDAAMCAVLDIDGDENGTVYAVTGNPASALQGGSGGGASCMDRCWVVPEGTIDLLSAADAGVGGALGAFDIWYIPIDVGAVIVAA
jgi:hypothetical protein